MDHDLPDWAEWNHDPERPAWTVGIEEEVMLVDPGNWALAHRIDDLLPELSPTLAASVSAETHACTLELATGVHTGVREAAQELLALRNGAGGRARPPGPAGRRGRHAPVRARRGHRGVGRRPLSGAPRRAA